MTSEEIAAFVAEHPDTAMITRRPDGAAHMARIEVAVLDGHLDDAIGHDRPYPIDEYLVHVREEQRLVYQFEVARSYGVL